MSLIRDSEEADLVELHAQGSQLVKRYRELLDDDSVPPQLRDSLQAVVNEREVQLDRLADRLRARDVLPSDGDPERALLQALGDIFSGELKDGQQTIVDRLIQAESGWAETLKQVCRSDLGNQDRAALDSLRRHIEVTCEALRAARNPPLSG